MPPEERFAGLRNPAFGAAKPVAPMQTRDSPGYVPNRLSLPAPARITTSEAPYGVRPIGPRLLGARPRRQPTPEEEANATTAAAYGF